MSVQVSDNLQDLAIHWAHVLVEDQRLSLQGIERFLTVFREECNVALGIRDKAVRRTGPPNRSELDRQGAS